MPAAASVARFCAIRSSEIVNSPFASVSSVTTRSTWIVACWISLSMSSSRSLPYSSTARRAPSSGSATASFQPRISAARNAFTFSGSFAIISSVVTTDSATNGRPLSANSRFVTSWPWDSTMIDSFVTYARKPSTSPLTSGDGSYSTGTLVTCDGSISLTASSASNSASLGPACTPIRLPTRSAGVAMSPPSVSDRIVNGFFWNVVPTIFSGARSSATT